MNPRNVRSMAMYFEGGIMGFILGLIVGACFGVFIMALLAAGREDES